MMRIAWIIAATSCALLIVTFISPRFAAVVIAVAFISIIFAFRLNRVWKWREAFIISPAIRWILVFASYAFLSAAWSAAPEESLLKAVFLGLIAIAVALGTKYIYLSSDRQAEFFSEAVVVASATGFLFIGIEIASDQWISRTVYTLLPELAVKHAKHVTVVEGVAVSISDTEINRRTTLAALLFWPAVSLIYMDRNTIRQFTAGACVGFGVFMIVLFGTHQSSQLALAVSGIAVSARVFALSITRKTLIISWTLVVFLALPIAWSFYALDAHKVELIPSSARHRVVIWNAMAELYKEKYLLGIGADATKTVVKQRRGQLNRRFSSAGYSVTHPHAHNVYLQVWLELGLVGVILFFVAGLYIFKLVLYGGLPFQTAATGQITLVASMIATSYSMWQPWLLSVIGIGALCTVLVQRSGLGLKTAA